MNHCQVTTASLLLCKPVAKVVCMPLEKLCSLDSGKYCKAVAVCKEMLSTLVPCWNGVFPPFAVWFPSWLRGASELPVRLFSLRVEGLLPHIFVAIQVKIQLENCSSSCYIFLPFYLLWKSKVLVGKMGLCGPLWNCEVIYRLSLKLHESCHSPYAGGNTSSDFPSPLGYKLT